MHQPQRHERPKPQQNTRYPLEPTPRTFPASHARPLPAHQHRSLKVAQRPAEFRGRDDVSAPSRIHSAALAAKVAGVEVIVDSCHIDS